MRKNESGQMTVESVLIIVMLLGFTQIISNAFNGGQYLAQVVSAPWTQRVAGMIENGVWGPAAATRAQHPNLLERHSSLSGDDVQ